MLMKKMNMFHPLTKNINLTSNAEHFPHNIRPLGSGFLIPMAGTFVITILISIFFCNVHYLKQKRKNALKMYFQRNVVTFHVNFYFLFSFSFLTFTSSLMRNISFEEKNNWIVLVDFMKVICSGLLRPIFIIYLLKKNMPDFFEDREEKLQRNNNFLITGHCFEPRKQIMSPYQPFRENARWGWQKGKVMTVAENASESNLMQKRFQIPLNSMPDVDI